MPAPTKPNTFVDFVFPLLGVLLITCGCYWAYRPLGPIALGVLLILIAVLGRRALNIRPPQ